MNQGPHIPSQFKDFTAEYITQLATERGYSYIQSTSSSSSDAESSLYNNTKTDTTEAHKLAFSIEGLACEYYTAFYTPVTYADSALSTKILSSSTNESTSSSLFQVQVFSVTLPYDIESLYVESRTNITLNNILNVSSVYFKESRRVSLEGGFDDFFRVFTPQNEEVTAFTILAPNIMLRLLEEGGNYDFEFSRNKIYFYKTFAYSTTRSIAIGRKDYDHLLSFGTSSAAGMARATRPAQRVTTTQQLFMWQLFGLKPLPLIVITSLIFLTIGLVCASIAIPFLWPLLGLFGLGIFIRYRQLLRRRAKLVAQWTKP